MLYSLEDTHVLKSKLIQISNVEKTNVTRHIAIVAKSLVCMLCFVCILLFVWVLFSILARTLSFFFLSFSYLSPLFYNDIIEIKATIIVSNVL